MKEDIKDHLAFQVRRICNALAKRMLILLEDLRSDHDIHYEKLKKSLPQEYHALIDQSNYLDYNKFSYYRKKILDYAGDSFRELSEEVEKYIK